MFDHLVITNGPREVYSRNVTTVTENRAPTDESVKLLREMEDRALANLLGRTKLEFNGIKARISVFIDPLNYMGKMVFVEYDFNGTKETIKVEIPGTLNEQERLDLMVSEVSNHFSLKLLQAFSDNKTILEIVR